MYKGTEIINYMEDHLGDGGSAARSYCHLGAGEPWCNAEVTLAFHEIDESKLFCNGRKETYCPHSIQWCYKNLASLPIYLALEGDIVYFDWERNGVPNHIGFARHRINDLQLATVEGNTSGGQIANRVREAKYIQAVFRPMYPVDKNDFDASKELEIDGCFGFNSVAVMQRFLMLEVDGSLGLITVKAWQTFLGVTADGDWGVKTTKATQKLVGVKVDGYCGKKTVIGLQKWLNKQVFHSGGQTTKPTTPTTSATKTDENKISSKAKKLAWIKGTAKSKYAWHGGRATKAFSDALSAHYPNHGKWGKAPSVGCSCDVFVGTVVRASGLDKTFPRGFDEQWTHKPSAKMEKLTYSNVSPYSVSKDGDAILYWKNSKGSSKHVLIRGKGCLYEAQYEKTYGHVNSSLSKIKTKRPKVVIFRAK